MSAAVGTAVALVFTAALAWAFVGIIVGGLGVLDDVTVSQASTAFELRRADPTARARAVYTAALRVGRDHVAATVNTLVLACVGAALPLLLLFTVGGEPLGTILTSELVAIEIVRSLVGSIGLVAAVPITTALAATAAAQPTRRRHAEADAESETAANPPALATTSRADAGGAPIDRQPSEDSSAAANKAWERRLRAAYGLDGGSSRGGAPPGQ